MIDHDIVSRPLGAYERYSLSRTRVGTPPVLAFLSQLPASASAHTLPDVQAACNELIRLYPLLSCTILDIGTREPRLGTKQSPDFQIAFEQDLIREDDATMLLELLGQAQDISMEAGPLWKVMWSKPIATKRPKLAMILNHTLSDGAGAKVLFAELLRLLLDPPSSPTPSVWPVDLPPTLESTVAVKPGLFHVIKGAATELLLPAFLQSFVVPLIWPEKLSAAPYECRTGMKTIRVEADTLTSLRTLAKARELTLQTMLHAAMLAAVTLGADKDKPLHVSGTTPISLRSTAAGHPITTGNYVGVFESLDRVDPTTSFLALCRKYAAQISSPAEKIKAKHNVGMLSWVPDPVLAADKQWTGFEEYILKKRERAVPFSSSFEVSNLGILEGPKEWPVGELEVVWAQAASTIGAALQLNVLSVAGGALSMSLTWRRNTIDDLEIDQIWQALLKIIGRLSQPLDEDTTLASLIL